MLTRILCLFLFICTLAVSVTAQSQNNTRVISSRTRTRQRQPLSQQNLGPRARQRPPLIQQRPPLTQQRRGDGQRRPLVQLRSSSRMPQRRPVINIQNLPRTPSRIPRARSFQAGLPNMRPTRIDPRLTARSRTMPSGRQRTGRQTPASRSLPRTRNQNALLSSICASPRSIRCFSWPRNRDQREAYMCDGECVGRTCPIPCECSCVDPRLIGRLRAVGRISGPELILIDPRLTDAIRRRQLRNRILAIRASMPGGTQTRRGISSSSGARVNNPPQQNSSTSDLSFGISDDVLATLIAQPVLNEIVGPQGINQILAGEPPRLLSRESRRQGNSATTARSNTVGQPDIRSVGTSLARAPPSADFAPRNQGMGIPVPLSRLNFDPIMGTDPGLGNMRVIMSDVRPFQDATTGLQLDMPSPTPVDSTVSVRQLPGTNVLFVDLTRSPVIQNSNPAGPGLSPQSAITSELTRNRPSFVSNITSAAMRSSSLNNVLLPGFNQTLPGSTGSEFGGSLQTFVGGTVTAADPRLRAPTQDECLAQRLELWCDPQKPWEGTPGLARWCLLNCRADNCDNQRCACACMEEIIFKAKYEQLAIRDPLR